MFRIVIVAYLLSISPICFGENNLVWWYNSEKGGKPSHAFAVATPFGEIWTLGQPDFPIYEIGGIAPIHTTADCSVKVGGYLSYWEPLDDWFLEPYAEISKRLGKLRFSGDLAIYAPLTSGSWALFSNSMRLTTPIDRNGLEVGVGATFLKLENAPCPVHWGLAVSKTKGKFRGNAYYLPLGGGADTLRFEIAVAF